MLEEINKKQKNNCSSSIINSIINQFKKDLHEVRMYNEKKKKFKLHLNVNKFIKRFTIMKKKV